MMDHLNVSSKAQNSSKRWNCKVVLRCCFIPPGSGPDGRITKKDVESFVPPKAAPVREVFYFDFLKIQTQPLSLYIHHFCMTSILKLCFLKSK